MLDDSHNITSSRSSRERVKSEFKSWYIMIMGLFYFGQGYALSSMVLLLPLYLLNELHIGQRSDAVAVSALIIFPWYIKFLFGLVSDNFPIRGLRRKPYLILATILSFVGWSTIGLHSNVSPLFILSGIFLAFGSAIGDAVIDGQAVEITPDHYIGRLQGVAWGCRGLGIGSAGLISSQLVFHYGWQTMFTVAGFFGVSITIIVLILPETGLSPFARNKIDDTDRITYIKNSLKKTFSKSKTKERILFFLLSGFALSIILQLTLIMETEFGYSIDKVGWGALMFAIGSFVGSIGNGYLTDLSDTMSKFAGLSIAYGITILSGLIFINRSNTTEEFLFFFAIGLFGGAYEAYQLKVIQEETEDNMEGTIFAIWTGISNIGQFAFGGLIIVLMADLLGQPILVTMQMVLGILIIAGFSLKALKFSVT